MKARLTAPVRPKYRGDRDNRDGDGKDGDHLIPVIDLDRARDWKQGRI